METKTISITTGTLIRTFMVVIFASLFLFLSKVVITLLVAVVLASAIEPWILFLKKYKMGRGISVSLIFLAILSLLFSVFYFLLPPLAKDVVEFLKHIPEMFQKVTFFGNDYGFSDLSLYFEKLSKEITPEKIISTVKNLILGGGTFFQAGSAIISSLISLFLTFVIAFYLATEEQGVQKFLRIVIPSAHEKYVEDLWRRAQIKFAYWLRGQLLLSLIISILVYIPLLIIGLPFATLLAVFVFFGELVPMVGILIATIPALIIAFVSGGFSLVLVVLAIYVVVNFLENHVIYPSIMNKAVGVPSVLILIGVLIGAELAGIWGVILSVPLSAVLMELASDVEKRKSVSTVNSVV